MCIFTSNTTSADRVRLLVPVGSAFGRQAHLLGQHEVDFFGLMGPVAQFHLSNSEAHPSHWCLVW